MRKKEKLKAKETNSAKLGQANETTISAKRTPASPARAKQTPSEAIPRSSPIKESQRVAAHSEPSGASPSAPAIRQIDGTLGQIVTILMRSSQHKNRPLADLEWLVMPALVSGQYRVAQAQQSGVAIPIGAVLWASVSIDVDQRLSDLTIPWRLQPDEWRSGDIPWLVELVADSSTQQVLLKHLGETIFRGRGIKMRVRDADGKLQIGSFKGAA